MSDITICIPCRGGSRRLPRKNLLRINGETLLARKIRQVAPLGLVVVGSDDDEMLAEAAAHGAVAVRRVKVNEGVDSANDMIGEFMSLIAPCDTVVWAHCTNPLLSTRTYTNALDAYRDGLDNGYDSLVSVHRMNCHFWSADARPLYDLEACRTRHLCAAELPSMYEQDGGIFIQPYSQMKANSYFFGERPRLFEIPDAEFLDINDERDWRCCLALV